MKHPLPDRGPSGLRPGPGLYL